MGQSEDQVPIVDIQEIGGLALKPALFGQSLAFRTMPIATGAVADAEPPAVVAAGGMTAQGGGTAPGDCPQYALLLQVDSVGGAIGVPTSSHDVGDLQRRALPGR
jgi:hypothetical protein